MNYSYALDICRRSYVSVFSSTSFGMMVVHLGESPLVHNATPRILMSTFMFIKVEEYINYV